MLTLFGVSTWIEVDGKELEQYGIEEDLDQNQVTCWIATQAGKNFSVVFRDNAPYRSHSLASYLEFDGLSCCGKVLHSHFGSFNFARNRTVVQTGRASSVAASRPFVFSKVELTDDDKYLDQSSARLGEIRISIHRVQPLESHLMQLDSSFSGHGKVHERLKKAVTHCVSYGQEVKTATNYICHVRQLDGQTPLATFIFKYKDLSLLQADGIIPKPLSGKERETTIDEVIDLTQDGDFKRELANGEIEVIENATQRAVPLKRSNSNCKNEAQPVKKVKREKGPAHTSEVIDLT